jgi:hypothetical protein
MTGLQWNSLAHPREPQDHRRERLAIHLERQDERPVPKAQAGIAADGVD